MRTLLLLVPALQDFHLLWLSAMRGIMRSVTTRR